MSRVVLTLEWIAAAVDGRLSGDGAREAGDIVTDSRTIQPGDVFVALRGPRFDGHAFAADVLARGAAAVVVERGGVERATASPLRAPAGASVIEVADGLAALQALAHAVRMAAGTRVVAITGSAGKTTTKEATAAFLASRFSVVKNKGNLNNHIGLPLSLMQLRGGPDAAVMELGMNHAGEISTLVRIARPDVCVWTNVGDAHLGFFASPDAIADAKAEILEGATPDTVLVANADDPRVMARAGSFPGRRLTFGEAPGASVRAVAVRDRGLDGVSADVSTPAGDVRLDIPLLGRANLQNVLAATAVAVDFGVPLAAVADAASALRPADRRGMVRRLANAVTLIDDSYNSSPSALTRALEVVAADRTAAGKMAVLGEMLELGDHATRLHEACGRVAAASGLRRLFVVGGPAAQALGRSAVEAGLPAASVAGFATSAEAADAVAAAVRPGDLVLVKGSRGTRTDVVADRIAEVCG